MFYITALNTFALETKVFLFKTSLALSISGFVIAYLTQNNLALTGFFLGSVSSGLGFWQSRDTQIVKELGNNIKNAAEEIKELQELDEDLKEETLELSQNSRELQILTKQIALLTKKAETVLAHIPQEEQKNEEELKKLLARTDRIVTYYSAKK
jgi:hypothetical protein